MDMITGIPISWASRQCVGAMQQGISQESLFEKCLIEPVFGDDRDRISSAQLTLLYMSISHDIGDEAHGIGDGKIELGFAELAVRTMLGCPDLLTSIQSLIKLYKLVGSGVQLELRFQNDEASLVVHCPEGNLKSTAVFLEDCYLSFLYMCITNFLGFAPELNSLSTRHTRHMDLHRRHWATSAPVKLDNVSALRMPKYLLLKPRSASPSPSSYKNVFLSWLKLSPGVNGIGLSPDQTIATLNLSDMAIEAHVSYSTMRRRCSGIDGSFRDRRKAMILNKALHLLRHGEESVDEIAYQLGYSDARGLRRLLKNATGQTPSEIRSGTNCSLSTPATNHLAVIRKIESFASSGAAVSGIGS